MILVDTSVLIDYFKGRRTDGAEKLEHAISDKIPFGISPFIFQEVLQGAGSEKEFILLKSYLETQIFYFLQKERESYAEAAKIYYRCRKTGITVSSTIDFLIVQTALEHNLSLLHNDRDFTAIKKVVPELRMY